jgi:hypothetical protein
MGFEPMPLKPLVLLVSWWSGGEGCKKVEELVEVVLEVVVRWWWCWW